LMLEMCGADTTLQIKEAPAGSVNRRCPDVSKLRELGYESQVSLREGLETMIPWYRGHFKQAGA
ncbi:MAG: epimerase, partial [Dehalococcoidia bacterium]|nr:epimerase [Dehalococcoidia bacterium]